jgi:hypothetical protein
VTRWKLGGWYGGDIHHPPCPHQHPHIQTYSYLADGEYLEDGSEVAFVILLVLTSILTFRHIHILQMENIWRMVRR